MKRYFSPFLLFSFSFALLAFSVHQLLALIASSAFPSFQISSFLLGACTSTFAAFILFNAEDYLIYNKLNKKSVFLISACSVCFGGAIFYVSDLVNQNGDQVIIIFTKWLFIGLFLCLLNLVLSIDLNSIKRGLTASLAAAILTTLVENLVYQKLISNSAGTLFVITSYILTYVFCYQALRLKFRVGYLKILNGSLAGYELDLNEPIITLGSQDSDDIVFNQLEESQACQVKFIRHDQEYLIVDNDASNNTSVNFRSVAEQYLKRGDILKIGSSLLQFCN